MVKTLPEIVIESGIDLISSGERFKAYCPFHKDDTPSFTIYPTGTYYCFGCQEWGDAVKFLVNYKGMSAREAMEYVGVDYHTPRQEKSRVIKVKNTIRTWTFLYEIAEQYHNYLLGLPGAMHYLRSRGLTDDTIRKYKLGYTDGKVLNLFYVWERELADEVLLMTRKGFETMSHRITIPNIVGDKQVDFIMGRTVINDNVKYFGTRMPKPLIGFHEVRNSPVIFIVEGQFDWLTLRQWGYPAISVSGSHLKAYLRLPLFDKKVIIVPDIDDNGEGQKAGRVLLAQFGDNAQILPMEKLKGNESKLDVNSLAQQENGEQLFADLVRSINWTTLLSKSQLNKWLPNSVTQISSALI